LVESLKPSSLVNKNIRACKVSKWSLTEVVDTFNPVVSDHLFKIFNIAPLADRIPVFHKAHVVAGEILPDVREDKFFECYILSSFRILVLYWLQIGPVLLTVDWDALFGTTVLLLVGGLNHLME
jgi:hypothetical protein